MSRLNEFDYSFSLDIDEDAPGPTLNMIGMDSYRPGAVAEAIAIQKQGVSLDQLFFDFSDKLTATVGMTISSNILEGEERVEVHSKLVNEEVKVMSIILQFKLQWESGPGARSNIG